MGASVGDVKPTLDWQGDVLPLAGPYATPAPRSTPPLPRRPSAAGAMLAVGLHVLLQDSRHPLLQEHQRLVARAVQVVGVCAALVGALGPHPFKGTLPPVGAITTGNLTLVAGKISEGAMRSYVKAFTGFGLFVLLNYDSFNCYADMLAAFVQFTYDRGVAARSTSSKLLCFIPYVTIAHEDVCGLAWKAMAGWGRVQPRVSWLPLPRELMLLPALTLLASRDAAAVDAGLATILAHHIYARGSEISLRLRHSDEKTTMCYLQDAQAHVLTQSLPPGVQQLVDGLGREEGLLALVHAVLQGALAH